jgi:hypothetical protein
VVSHLRVFDCLAFAKELGHISKLDDMSTLGVFIGYAEGSKAYHILDSETFYLFSLVWLEMNLKGFKGLQILGFHKR